MKLYYAEVINPRKVCAVARHIGAPVEYVKVALEKGEHRSPAFRAKNPNAKVPVLEDGDTVMWESDAIMCHLCWHTGSDLWPRDRRQIELVRWLSWNQAHLNRCVGPLYFEQIIKPRYLAGVPDQRAVEAATAEFLVFGRVLDDHLESRRYLLGDTLSVADFAVSAILPYADAARLPLETLPAIRRWRDRLETLPAWRDPYPSHDAAP